MKADLIRVFVILLITYLLAQSPLHIQTKTLCKICLISYPVRVYGVSCSHSPEPCWSAPPAPSLVAWEVWVEEAAFFARLVQSHSLLKLHWLSFWPLDLRPVHAPIPHQPHSPSLISTSNPGGLIYANCFLQEITVSTSKVTKDGHFELQ